MHDPRDVHRQALEQAEPPIMTLVSALLFLYVGFAMGLVGSSDHQVYNASVTAFVWGARIVGIGLLLVALLSFLKVRGVLWLDVFLGAVATTVCALVGIIWLLFRDMQGILLLAFALLNFSATRSALVRYRPFLRLRKSEREFERNNPPEPPA